MPESQPNVTKERPPYEWLRYIAKHDLSKITDVGALRFATEELPECIAYHENWLREADSLMTAKGWMVDVQSELNVLNAALVAAKKSLSVALAISEIQFTGSESDTYTCDKCGNVIQNCNGCDDDQPNTCDDCYEVKND